MAEDRACFYYSVEREKITYAGLTFVCFFVMTKGL